MGALVLVLSTLLAADISESEDLPSLKRDRETYPPEYLWLTKWEISWDYIVGIRKKLPEN